MRLNVFFFVCFLLLTGNVYSRQLIEAESFSDKGGWVIDSQFMDQMGSPYLMAHGLGTPVTDAKTTILLENGVYKVWVRTFNWVSPWYKAGEGPGAFMLSVDGKRMKNVLGTKGNGWMWQEAGIVEIDKKNNASSVLLELVDLSGFNGRIDAIFFSEDLYFVPSDNLDDIKKMREEMNPHPVKDQGNFDMVIAGGGLAGCCAAISAARLGLRVALINNRPVLGGNNSSEIRVGLSGKINANYYPKIGNILRELTGILIPDDSHKELGDMHPLRREASNEMDNYRRKIIESEQNISLFLNVHVNGVEMDGNSITSVVGENVETGERYRWNGMYFADCTGDGNVGYLAGADYRTGRESYDDFFEPSAPLVRDNHKSGSTLLWRSVEEDKESDFPILPWAMQFSDDYYIDSPRGRWWWEAGFGYDNIAKGEYIRDYLLYSIFGNWSYLKNNIAKYKNYRLSFIPYVEGRRESKRLLGDVILTENDLLNQVDYPDKSYTTTWPIDLHYVDTTNSKRYPKDEWISYCKQPLLPAPYHVPYRTLYSRNIKNLFMAGRNVSVTHIALGTVRVMATTSMMGEVVGMAAKICKQYDIFPRDVYKDHLVELQDLMKKGIPTRKWDITQLPEEKSILNFDFESEH